MADAPESITVSNAGFTFPTSEILTGRGFCTGKSGSGKSNTVSVIAEELLGHGLPLLIVDTDGEYYGLKSQFELLHVGAEADSDVTVGVEHADKLAELALLQNVPIVLDISGYVDEAERHELVRRVVERLFELGKQARKPFPIFVEEIHEFLPQSGGLDELGEMLITVAKRGRKRGIGICGMSQRPAAVDKDFITQCDWIVWHRLTWDNDKRVASQMLGGDTAAAIDDLDTGEALVMTDWDDRVNRVHFRKKRTFDAGATPDLDDIDAGSYSPVRTGLLSELAEGGGDLNDLDLDAVEAASDVPPPEPEPDLEAAADELTAPQADDAVDAKLEATTSPATERGGGDVVTVPRPTYSPPERTDDDSVDYVWELGHLTVYLATRVTAATMAFVAGVLSILGRLVGEVRRLGHGLVAGAIRVGALLRRDLERLGGTVRGWAIRPTVRNLELVAARRIPDRVIAATAILLLVIAIALLLLA